MEKKLVDEFFDTLSVQGKLSGTIWQYKYGIQSFEQYLSDKNIFSFIAVTKENITEYYLFLIQKGYAHKTCFNKSYPVFSFYEWLKSKGIILFNPCVKPQVKNGYTIPRNIANEKAINRAYKRLRESSCITEKRDLVIIDLAYSCGLRRCELHRLDIDDINIDEEVIKVVGKGSKERVVPIGENTLNILLDYVFYIRPWLIKKRKIKALFVSWNKGGRRMHRGSINKAFMRMRKKYQLDNTISPHALRHAFATHLLKNGAPVQDVSKMLGHEKLETTQIYTKVVPTDLKKHYKTYHPRA